MNEQPSLLLVDDDAVFAGVLARALARRGYEVATADSAEAALSLAQANPPEFAVVAQGEFQSAAVLACAARLLRVRSGEPARSRLGSFQLLRDQKGAGELAVRTGGPLISSGGLFIPIPRSSK